MPLNACSNSICRPSGSAGFLTALEEENRDAAERIKALMFTFDDLVKLDAGSAQTLMRDIGKDKLAVALKGANETVRQFLFTNMSSRAAKMLVEDMQAMGPVRCVMWMKRSAACQGSRGQGRNHHRQEPR